MTATHECEPGTARVRVGFILTPQFTLTAFAGFVDVLRLAADEGDRSRPIRCRWSVLGTQGLAIRSSCGVDVLATEDFGAPQRFDYVVVVGGLLRDVHKLPAKSRFFLKAAAATGACLVGVGTGSFVLARAGLLDGYRACVSWFHLEDFTAQFPALAVTANQMYVIDRDRLTCAGGTSAMHLAAHLIEKHCGAADATKSLRILIEDQPLPSSAPQPEHVLKVKARDAAVRKAMLLMEQALSQPVPMRRICDAVGMSARQLQRRFFADVGISPREYRVRLRLSRARWLVDHTESSLTDIALECGFAGGAHLSRAFLDEFEVRPSVSRRKARSPSSPPRESA